MGSVALLLAFHAPALRAQTLSALDPSKDLTQYTLDAWTTDQGLPNATINAILQSRDGYVWLGTYDGLARFDGVRFTVFSRSNTPAIGNNGIRALCEDRDGALWIGTNGGGLTRFANGRFTRYTMADGLPADIVWALHPDTRDASLWIGTNGGGLAHFKDGRFTRFPPAESGRVISTLTQDVEGTLWVGTQDDGLKRLSPDGRFADVPATSGITRHPVTTLTFDRSGALWVGSSGGGIVVLREGRLVAPPDAVAALRVPNVSAIIEDRQGTLWIGTNGGGIARYRAGRLSVMTTLQGLPGDVVYSLREDREGALWVGTNGAGVGRLRDGSFSAFTTREGLARDFTYTAFEDHQGTVWVGNAGGLDRLEGGHFVPANPAAAFEAVRTIAEDRAGDLWVGTYGAGIWRRHGTRWTRYRTTDGLASDNVRALLVDHTDRVWAATLSGLSVLESGVWKTYRSPDGLPKDSLIGLAEDRSGAIWVGTDGGGLCRYRDGRFEVFTTLEGLPSDLVLALHVDTVGVLWVGTNGGLSRFDGRRFVSFTAAAGLPSDAVTQVVDGGDGQLWIGTSRGVSRIPRKSLERSPLASARLAGIRTFEHDDGMKSNQCTAPGQPAGFGDRQGRLWFATARGVVAVVPRALRDAAPPPPVTIEEVVVDGVKAALDRVVVPPGPARIQFRYTGLSLFSPDRQTFRFQLQGFDDAWVDARNRRLADYTGVPPGDYVFRVSARNPDGAWNEQVASVALQVQPRFYQTRLFALVTALGLIGLVAAGYRLRLRSLVARERELTQQVDERTRSLALAKEGAEAARAQAERLLAATRAIGATIDLESVLGLILAELQRVVPYDSASVQELHGNRLDIVAGRGFPSMDGLRGQGFDITASDNPNRDVLRLREPLILDDAPLVYPGFANAPGASGIRSWLGVPLLFGERLTGMLTLDKRQPGYYTDAHAQVAVAFAAQAAIALENARLYGAARQELAFRERAQEELRRQSEYLASLHETALAVMNRFELQPLLEALVLRAAGLLGVPNGFLYLETADASALECRVSVGSAPLDPLARLDEGAVGRVYQSGQPLAIADYDTWEGRSPQVSDGIFGAMVAVPLRFGGRVGGALGLAHNRDTTRRFGEPEMQLLSSFAQLASIALDNARLFEREHAARDRAERLQAATRALSASIDLGTVFDRILLELEKVVPSDSASIQVLREDSLEIIGGRGHAAGYIGRRSDPRGGDGRGHEVITRREPLIREAHSYPDAAAPTGLRSWLGVPLLFGDRVIGMLALNKREAGFYTPELAGLAQAFATQAAVAIENARLYGAARQELEERRQAQEALQKSEARYRDLFEQSLGLICTHDLDGRLLSVNPAAAASLSREPEAMVGHALQEFLPASAQAPFVRYLGAIVRDHAVAGTLNILTNQGEERDWRYRNVLRATPEGEPYVIGFAQDVTEEGLAQQALKDSEERFRQLAENIDAVFFIRATDPVRVLYVSPAYEKVWGRPRAPLYQGLEALFETIHPEDRAVYRAALARQVEGYDIEYRILHPDGSVRWIHTRVFPVRDQQGAVSRVAGIAEDVTERKLVEHLREDLTHTMVHDIKNPLTAIMGGVELLEVALDELLSAEQRRVIQIASSNSRRLLRLVETILDVSRLEGGAMPVERERFPLSALVGEILDLERPLAAPRNLRLVNEAGSDLPAVWADRGLVGRVLQNLVGNAIKFTPEGGSIRVAAEVDRTHAGRVRVRVDDSGPGVPEEMLGRLFQKFSAGRQKGRGSGLGLLFCRLAVEAQGGRIWVDNAPGTGARFVFTLPA